MYSRNPRLDTRPTCCLVTRCSPKKVSGLIFCAQYCTYSVNCSYTGLVGLGLRFRVRYTRNPVYPNTGLCTKHTVSCFCAAGLKFSAVRYVREFRHIRLIDCMFLFLKGWPLKFLQKTLDEALLLLWTFLGRNAGHKLHAKASQEFITCFHSIRNRRFQKKKNSHLKRLTY